VAPWPVHRALLAALVAPVLALGVYWAPLRALAEDALALWPR
jgi:hypothetical protein